MTTSRVTDGLTDCGLVYCRIFQFFNQMIRTLLRNFTITKHLGDEVLKFRRFTTAAPLGHEEEG